MPEYIRRKKQEKNKSFGPTAYFRELMANLDHTSLPVQLNVNILVINL
jgi:hypothetical protein